MYFFVQDRWAWNSLYGNLNFQICKRKILKFKIDVRKIKVWDIRSWKFEFGKLIYSFHKETCYINKKHESFYVRIKKCEQTLWGISPNSLFTLVRIQKVPKTGNWITGATQNLNSVKVAPVILRHTMEFIQLGCCTNLISVIKLSKCQTP